MVLQDLVVDRQIGHCPPQPGVLALQLLQPPGLGDLHAAIFDPPAVIRLFRNLERLAHLGHRLPLRQRHFRLAELRDDLLRRMSSASHLVPLSQSHPHIEGGLVFGGQVKLPRFAFPLSACEMPLFHLAGKFSLL